MHPPPPHPWNVGDILCRIQKGPQKILVIQVRKPDSNNKA